MKKSPVYPQGFLICILRPEQLDAALEQLHAVGLIETHVHFQDQVLARDMERFQLLQHLNSFSDVSVILQEHLKAWEEGGLTLAVRTSTRPEQLQARDILLTHDGQQMMVFGRVVHEVL
ncbi:hypothetical protein [Deinococcus cellulosilyticus]|uniref:Uncharacterized protein n=1 Tax=Deinococcus cellulosilyticus (strain DSM 18568 / NBRC 106333 / KACC 11606 / 5516J-15) TaxID=1223518 RepID=A0A511NAQ6_DEIC1|nr:hypothetical protein [Deinococcus cellulosilyticus]GEM49890.1 hypothetical protein DC3_55250 [Deinococcus cellulosilyticus NBRC 106333 = KACC 11606]